MVMVLAKMWGNKRHMAKLDFQKAEEIRAKYKAGGTTYAKLAEEYGVNVSSIAGVVKGGVWCKPL
jgi:hypothetical protein